MPLDQNHENYTTYEELEEYVQAFQAGNEEAGMSIIKSFEGFITDYALLVHKGVFNINDPKLREFVRLYMKGEQRKYIKQYKYKPRVRAELYRTASKIHEIFSVCSYEEIQQELMLAVLQLAKRYRVLPDKPRFHVYMMRTYHFEARRRLQNLFYYESKRTIKNLVVDTGDDGYHQDEEWGVEDKFFQPDLRASFGFGNEYSELEDEEVIDEEWILGWRCGDYFNGLSVLERRIVKMYYWDGNTDQQVADELGMCRVTINRYRLRAQEKISDRADGFNLFVEE